MKKLPYLLLALLFFTTTGLFASNMGFKLTYNLKKTPGRTNTNYVALPAFWSGSNAQDVCNDIGAAAVQIGIYDEATDTTTSYACGGGGTNFPLTSGQGIFVKVTTDNTPWVIVGSHNDTLSIPLQKTAGRTNTNYVAVPYHTTATNAQGICNQIPQAVQIGKYDEPTDTTISYACGGGGTNFNITPGEGIFIKVTNATNWTPAHY
jgi:hypothetical protein